jgi:hypothetical protein
MGEESDREQKDDGKREGCRAPTDLVQEEQEDRQSSEGSAGGSEDSELRCQEIQ